jgi:hypothetical protein
MLQEGFRSIPDSAPGGPAAAAWGPPRCEPPDQLDCLYFDPSFELKGRKGYVRRRHLEVEINRKNPLSQCKQGGKQRGKRRFRDVRIPASPPTSCSTVSLAHRPISLLTSSPSSKCDQGVGPVDVPGRVEVGSGERNGSLFKTPGIMIVLPASGRRPPARDRTCKRVFCPTGW